MILNRFYGTSGGGESATIKVLANEGQTVTATKGAKVRQGVWRPKPNPEWKGLPEGYTQVEWIESDGTGYFDLGIIPNSNDLLIKFEADFNSAGQAFAVYEPTGGKKLGLEMTGGTTLKFSYADTSNNSAWKTTSHAWAGHHSIEWNNQTLKIDDNVINLGTYAYTSRTLYFSAYNGASLTGIAKMKFGILETGHLGTRQYRVACYRDSDNKIGLYDINSDTFLESIGGFTTGADVPQYDGYAYYIDNIDEYGTWTVSNGTRTKDVEIEEVTEYEVDLFRTYLYRDGDECVDLTGGWSVRPLNSGVLTKNATTMRLYANNTSSIQAYTINPVSLDGFSTYNVEVSSASGVRAVAQCVVDRSGYQNAIVLEEPSNTSGKRVISVPIGQNNNIHMGFSRFGANVAIEVSKVWLE